MSTHCILGIDIGTSSCKAILVDENINILARATKDYPLFLPRPGWTEQHPEDWWQGVKEAIGEIRRKMGKDHRIEAIGLSGQMHGLVALDEKKKVLRPCILWNDQRSAPQCEKIYSMVGGKSALLSHTNNSMIPGYTAGKIMWVKENEPHIFSNINHILLPKDYIRYRLTGQLATEVSDASGTGLFDVKKKKWASELLQILGIPKNWLPRVYESSEVTGNVTDSVAKQLGLSSSPPVMGGGGDAVIQAVGSGVVSEEAVMVVIGTAGNVAVSLPSCPDNPEGLLQIFCNVISDRWIGIGCTLAAGGSLHWLHDNLGALEAAVAKDLKRNAYDILSEEAQNSPCGSNGLLFLPYLVGERCPHTDPHAKGAFVGLGLHTTKSDMIRSVYEGVVYSLYDAFGLMSRIGADPTVVRASGGGALSPLWRQIQADVFDREVTTVRHSGEGAALGAAIVAGVGLGTWSSAKQAVSLLGVESRTQPIEENVQVYKKLFPVYQRLYHQLKPSFDDLQC